MELYLDCNATTPLDPQVVEAMLPYWSGHYGNPSSSHRAGRIAKDVFEIMVAEGKEAVDIVEEKGLKQITDTSAIETAVDEVIANNPEQVEQFKSGNEKIAGWFVGQVMKATGGKANPPMVNQMLKDKLK